jgi:hypothetical protein
VCVVRGRWAEGQPRASGELTPLSENVKRRRASLLLSGRKQPRGGIASPSRRHIQRFLNSGGKVAAVHTPGFSTEAPEQTRPSGKRIAQTVGVYSVRNKISGCYGRRLEKRQTVNSNGLTAKASDLQHKLLRYESGAQPQTARSFEYLNPSLQAFQSASLPRRRVTPRSGQSKASLFLKACRPCCSHNCGPLRVTARVDPPQSSSRTPRRLATFQATFATGVADDRLNPGVVSPPAAVAYHREIDRHRLGWHGAKTTTPV